MEKTIPSRVIHKHDTEANWNKAVNFIPKQGELIIYDRDSNYAYERAKIGDGVTKVSALPFANEVESIQDKGITWSDTPTEVDNTISPLTMALEPEFGANRFAFFPPSCIICEYSRDGGATWTVDPAATDRQKVKLTTLHSSELCNGGRAKKDTGVASDMYRITFSFKDTTANLSMQLSISKFMIDTSNASSNIGTKVLIERATTTGEFSTVHQVALHDEGWHDINCNLYGFGPAVRLRFTFSVTSMAYYNQYPLGIKGIFCYANQGYGFPSNLALNNHLYQIRLNGSAYFPKNISAPTFEGNLQGTASRATNDANGNNIEKTYLKKVDNPIAVSDTEPTNSNVLIWVDIS